MIYTGALKAVVCYTFDDVVDNMDVDLNRLTPAEERTLDEAWYFFMGIDAEGKDIQEQMQVVCDLNQGIAMVYMRDLGLYSEPPELENTTVQEVLDLGDISSHRYN